MENWNKIKEFILFDYLGDWKQIVIENYSLPQYNNLVSFIDQLYGIIPAKNPKQADSFKVNKIQVFIYQNKDWQFDFDPKQISKASDLDEIIELMRQLAHKFKKRVFLTHEAINDYPLITVSEDRLSFHYNFWDKFKEI